MYNDAIKITMNHDKMRVNDMLKKTLNEREPFSSEISGNTNIHTQNVGVFVCVT